MVTGHGEAKGRITVERILDGLDDIGIADAERGPPRDRHYEYVPSYILRGGSRLELEWMTNTSGRPAISYEPANERTSAT